MRRATDKIKSFDELAALAKASKENGRILIQCDGVFDLVHMGHVEYFSYAKTLGDILYVVIVGDAFVRKGPGRPLFNETTRARWVAALECVDYVLVNQDFGPYKVIQEVRPNVLVKGEGYKTSPTEGFLRDRALVESYGGRAEFAPPELMHSTDIIKKIYKAFD